MLNEMPQITKRITIIFRYNELPRKFSPSATKIGDSLWKLTLSKWQWTLHKNATVVFCNEEANTFRDRYIGSWSRAGLLQVMYIFQGMKILTMKCCG